jgi:integrase
MGTIITRTRDDGTKAYRAQIVRKKGGKIVHRESETFERQAAAKAWLSARETALKQPGALERVEDPILADVIDRYIAESARIGRTKLQALNKIKTYAIALLRCSKIGSTQIIEFAQEIKERQGIQAATVSNYLSHLGAIFTIARPAWGYPLDDKAMDDAFLVGNRLGITGTSRRRERRPTLAELDKIMTYFGRRKVGTMPMQNIIAFAIFSTRRQEEITLIRWPDYEPASDGEPARVLVRDMKHPGEKIGNDTWCDLPPEAAAIIEAMPRQGDLIFPYNSRSVSANFTRACQMLEINIEGMADHDCLHFHDLRHDGVSRLFEMGATIPRAASVSGHKNWQSLQRYTHIRKTGDKYAGWKWANPQQDAQQTRYGPRSLRAVRKEADK